MAGVTKENDFTIEQLGPCKVPSPIELSNTHGDFRANYVKDTSYVRNSVNVYEDMEKIDDLTPNNLMQKAGPREMIYFDPVHVNAAICTCGGLCPGLNDVIRAVVNCLWQRYGVHRITGFRFGYKGFLNEYSFDTVPLDPDSVDTIHKIGGSILGTSRGGGNRVTDIVDCLERLNINQLYVIGGDGSQRGSYDIACEVSKRHIKCAVVGIPKTVDNDLEFIVGMSLQTGLIHANRTGDLDCEVVPYLRAIGVPEDQLRKAASMAVCKINIDSDIRLAMTACIRKYFAEHPDHFDPRQYLKPARQAVKEMVAHKIVDVLGCDGKA